MTSRNIHGSDLPIIFVLNQVHIKNLIKISSERNLEGSNDEADADSDEHSDDTCSCASSTSKGKKGKNYLVHL